MLHWFAGQKAGEDPDATGNFEAPETPAPVFAVRAFKHAIFGTPQTIQTKPRRHSNTEYARPRNLEPKPSRPSLNRPQSTNDAQKLVRQEILPPEEPLISPSKGILLTPGAAAARKKNVTFGEHVVDNEEKRPLKSGLPDDCPGKFPSPWNKDGGESKTRDESPNKARGRNKLTEALEQVRDESRKRKSASDKFGNNDNDQLGAEFAEPRSDEGRFWKREYDIYRNNTQREVKKLITKQKMAKNFAAAKDRQCTELSDELREEQKKVDMLEAKTREFESLIKDLQDQLRKSKDTERKRQKEITMLRHELGVKDNFQSEDRNSWADKVLERDESARRTVHDRANSLQGQGPRKWESYKHLPVEERLKIAPAQQPSEPYNTTSDRAIMGPRSYRARDNSKVDNVQLKSSDDIWAQLDSSSNPVVAQSINRESSAPKGSHIVTSGTDATPLKALNINSLPTTKQDSSPRSPEVDGKPGLDLERIDSKSRPQSKDEQLASPLLSPALPFSSSEIPQMGTFTRTNATTQCRGLEFEDVDPPKQTAETRACTKAPTSQPVSAVVSTGAVDGATAAANNTKENVLPASKSQTLAQELNLKPSALWSSINASSGGNRTTSVTGKDGKELSHDRIAAARARIAARGRVTS